MDIISVALKRHSTKAFDASKKLTAEEAELYGGAKALIASGLYVEDKPAAGKKADKDGE